MNRPCKVAVCKTSGAAGIAHWINDFFKLTGEAVYDKKHPIVEYVKTWVDKQYDDGRVTSMTDNELEAATKEAMQLHREGKLEN